jgi:hypothetical protein
MYPKKLYLVDSEDSNRAGFLAPYTGTKYHLPEFWQGPRPVREREVFNYLHSSRCIVIEHSFGVLKMKRRRHLAAWSHALAGVSS